MWKNSTNSAISRREKIKKKKLKRKKWPKESNHHLVAKTNSSKWFNVHKSANIKRLCHEVHVALHTVFWTELPQEQLQTRFDIHRPILWEVSIDIFKCLISLDRNDFYKKWICREDFK